MSITHAKVNAIPDDPAAVAAGEVVPSDWNAAHSLPTPTEIGAIPQGGPLTQDLDADSSAILNALLTSATLTNNLAAGGHKITGLVSPSAANDAVNKGYVDDNTVSVAYADAHYDAIGAAAAAQAAAATDATTKANAAAAASIAKTLVTTKGDLIVATASGVVARLGVGADNQVLTADSSQTSGLKFADVLTVSGASGRASCRLATAAVLSGTPTYSNGTAGVGATLTEVGFGALTVDGVAVALNDRVLVKDQADPKQNGIYVQSILGTGLISYVLTRSTDYDQSVDIFEGTFTVIEEGTANIGTAWQQTTSGTITPGTSSIVFAVLKGEAVSVATPQAIGTAAAGTSTTKANDDHVHPSGAGTPTTQAFGDAAAVGTGPAAAMTDHKHGMMAAVTRASLGLATSDTPQFAGIEVGAASDTTLARVSAGVISVEGNTLYAVGGTDVAVADGGTGASDAATALANLGAMSQAQVFARMTGA